MGMKRQLSVNEIYEMVQNEIVSLAIKPNEMLGENALSARFGVSRTPIRSVLQRLQENGFVRIIPGKGTFVEPINIEIASELIYLRVSVESRVLRDFIMTASPTDIESVRYAYHMLLEAAEGTDDIETFDINNFLQKDLDMHKIWFKTMNKMHLWDLVTKPHPDYSRFIRLDIVGARNVPDVINEHGKIMELIDSKTIDGIEPTRRYNINKRMNNMKRLVTYFSASGVTRKAAEELAAVAKADIHEIKPAEPYTREDLDWRNKKSRSSLEMQNEDARPALDGAIPDLSEYDTVYIGFPIWWGVAPRVVNTFIENSDLKDKDLIVFATSGGSGLEYAVNDLRKRYPGLNIRSGRLVKGKVTEDMA